MSKVSLFKFLLPVVFIFLTGCEKESSSYTVGLVTNNPNGLNNVQGFKDGLAELGYKEGDNLTILSADKPLRGEALSAQLSKFVDSKVDLIFTAGTPTGVAAYKATADTDIPVIFGVIADPIKAGVMRNLTAPGGNLSGVRISNNQALRMDLMKQLVPDAKTFQVMFNPNDAAPMSAIAQLKESAEQLGVTLTLSECPDNSAIDQVLAHIPQKTDVLFLLPDSVVNRRIKDIVKVSIDQKIPLSGPTNLQVEKGALMAYGIVHYEAGHQAARMAHQVLSGVKTAQLPVETAESYLGINLETAQAIGLQVPDSLLHQAKVIIRPKAQ
ncbi:ABC transporter substrate-binding protein [Vibrio sp. JC009]|uniref:ABC transporter substrate-binding protein n=1 Tax=Vibrio sp. JC009 TaxID=2912314 RepID=UPI0023B0E7E8|nr:ABC transporter substrate-binding protein [Vibrio sp. JC009]WED24288.1 ABC transporter substrate-binding protein [Vibrio sp. JC009]